MASHRGCWQKETVHGSKQFIFMAKSECIKPYPTSQGGPEIKSLLQGVMSGKGSLLAKPSGPGGTSLTWRTLFLAFVTTSFVSFM
ncbi:mCG148064 [Mus musculus]|jgi:hypothetical protein|nr:mCG148064 [Mus musculus]